MRQLKLSRAFTLIEPGPVVLVTTCDGSKNNVMTISWTMVLDFTPDVRHHHGRSGITPSRPCERPGSA